MVAKVNRPRRTSINGARLRTEIRNKEAGFKYRLVNDIDDRVQDFIDRGYEIVTDTNVSVGDKRVANPSAEGSPIKVSVGNGVQGYVMRIKEEWWKEDHDAKNKLINEREEQINRDAKVNNFYGKVEIK